MIGFVPVILLAYWGVVFLSNCFLTLLNPSVPLVLTYVSPSGPITVRAESFAISLSQPSAVIEKITVKGVTGELIAGAGGIRATAAQRNVTSTLSLVSEDCPLEIQIERPYAKLLRDRSGRISLPDYLPKSQGEPSKRPYLITVGDGVVDVVDRKGGNDYRSRVLISKASVGALGKNWTASGTADADGIGHVAIAAQATDAEMKISVQGLNVVLTDLVRHLSQADLAEALRGLSVETALARDANLVIDIHPGQPISVSGSALVEATGVKYQDFVSNGQATASLNFAGPQAFGDAKFSSAGVNVSWRGGVQWNSGFVARGNVDAFAASSVALPIAFKKYLPARSQFRAARYTGLVAYDKASGPHLLGSLSANEVQAASERFVQVHGLISYDKTAAIVSVGHASWSAGQIKAWGKVDNAKGLSGAVALTSANLATIGHRYGINDLGGHGSVFASLAGSTQAPIISMTSQGEGEFVNQQEGFRGAFAVAGMLNGDHVRLTRATWNGPTGKALATGEISAQTGQLALSFDTFGIDLSALNPEVSGSAAARGTVHGTLKAPLAQGHAEAYDVAFQSFQTPLGVTDFSSDLRHLNLRNIRIASGQGLVEGRAALGYRDRSLSGELKGESLQPADFGADSVAGVVDLDRILLSGTINKPSLRASIKSNTLVANGIDARSISAGLSYDHDVVTVAGATALIGSGKVSGSGHYDLNSKDGSASFIAEALPLTEVPESISKHVHLDGLVSASGQLDMRHGKAVLTGLKGTADALSFNRVVLGSGEFDVHQEGERILGSAEIGSLERYLRAQDFAYDLSTRRWSGELIAADLNLQNLYQLGQPYLGTISDDAARKLSQLDATVSLDALIEGSDHSEPDVDLRAMEIADISYAASKLGKIDVKATKKGSVIDLSNFAWVDGDSTGLLKGTADLHGDLNLNGELSKFKFSKIGLVEPQLSGIDGEATISFLATGKTEAPDIMASLDSNRVEVGAGGASALDFGLEISSLHLIPGEKQADGRRQGQIEAAGAFNYRGIGGTLQAKAPFLYPFEFPNNKPFDASVALDPQQISAFKTLLPTLDMSRSQGTLNGSFKVGGTLNGLVASGGLTASASTLAFASSKTAFQNASASLTFSEDTLLLSLMATSSRGGTANGLIQSKLADFSDLATSIASGRSDDLLKSQLKGSLDVQNFKFDEGRKDTGQATGALTSHLNFGGTLKRPTISGNARLIDGVLALGGAAGPPTAIPQYAVNPAFDIDLGLDSARVRSGSAQFGVIGGGHLGGSLARPDLQADMTLLNGSLRLPGAKVNLEPGGTMRLAYQTNQEGVPDARLDVALEGHTSLTAGRVGGTAQRYDITLDVRGNLLADNGLTQTATSDPPDLSQDRILAMLGQTQIFEAFTGQSSAGGGDAQKQVRDALTGYALPVALDPITSRIADSLGLDYLTVEYNPFDLTTITFARALNRSFILQGRRQIGEPAPGRKPIVDLQLIYRLPVRKGLLNRVSFSVGIDQDRPWKLAAQYSSRF